MINKRLSSEKVVNVSVSHEHMARLKIFDIFEFASLSAIEMASYSIFITLLIIPGISSISMTIFLIIPQEFHRLS